VGATTVSDKDDREDPRARMAGNCRRQALGAEVLGSPLYAEILRRMAVDVQAGGPTWALLADHAAAGLDAAYPLRVLGGAHRLALTGGAVDLARHLPSTGGDGDVDGTWDALRALMQAAPPEMLDALTRPPQTNEVGRSASLIGGFLVVATETQRPVRALEIGSSAGLNLRFDRYRYEQDDRGFGPPDARVRFAGLWADGRPPFDAPLEVVSRRGCDVDPIDASTDDGRLTLLSYVWPDQRERFERMAGALDIAAEVPATVDRADAARWLEERLAEPADGTTTVVFHSIMWQYLPAEKAAEVTQVIEDAGGRATGDAPVAWLRLEPFDHMKFPELRLRVWPGGEERKLAIGSFHAGPVEWLV
jgi:hypothetical protein